MWENVNISIDWRPVCVHAIWTQLLTLANLPWSASAIAWMQTGPHSILKSTTLKNTSLITCRLHKIMSKYQTCIRTHFLVLVYDFMPLYMCCDVCFSAGQLCQESNSWHICWHVEIRCIQGRYKRNSYTPTILHSTTRYSGTILNVGSKHLLSVCMTIARAIYDGPLFELITQ